VGVGWWKVCCGDRELHIDHSQISHPSRSPETPSTKDSRVLKPQFVFGLCSAGRQSAYDSFFLKQLNLPSEYNPAPYSPSFKCDTRLQETPRLSHNAVRDNRVSTTGLSMTQKRSNGHGQMRHGHGVVEHSAGTAR